MDAATNTMSGERVLVTGGAGFIGSHLCDRLLAEGAEVHALDNFDPFYERWRKEANLAQALSNPRFTLTEGDIRDAHALRKVLDWSPTALCHLAALAGVRPSITQPAHYMDVNVVGTARLLEACVHSGLDRIIFASSSSVYGNRTDVPFRETDRIDDPISPYAASKAAGELLCHTYSHLHGLNIAALRFFTVYGPRQRPEMAIHKFVRMILANETLTLFGDGTSSRDYTYVGDIVDGVLCAMGSLNGFQVLNLGESQTCTLNDLVAAIERATGHTAQRTHSAPQPGDVARTFADISRAKALGYAPAVGIDEGVRRFVEWFRDSGETRA